MEDYLGFNTWLTQKAIARILGTSQQNISVHIRNILQEHQEYEKFFVKKNSWSRKKANPQGCSQKYYHGVIMELVAERVKNVKAQEVYRRMRSESIPSRIKGFAMVQIAE